MAHHCLFRIDLPANDGGIVKRCLQGLAARFNTTTVKIDEGVHNSARIWKLPGTLACKGDNTPERPHRIAQMLPALAAARRGTDRGCCNGWRLRLRRKISGGNSLLVVLLLHAKANDSKSTLGLPSIN